MTRITYRGKPGSGRSGRVPYVAGKIKFLLRGYLFRSGGTRRRQRSWYARASTLPALPDASRPPVRARCLRSRVRCARPPVRARCPRSPVRPARHHARAPGSAGVHVPWSEVCSRSLLPSFSPAGNVAKWVFHAAAGEKDVLLEQLRTSGYTNLTLSFCTFSPPLLPRSERVGDTFKYSFFAQSSVFRHQDTPHTPCGGSGGEMAGAVCHIATRYNRKNLHL